MIQNPGFTLNDIVTHQTQPKAKQNPSAIKINGNKRDASTPMSNADAAMNSNPFSMVNSDSYI